jgi:hypothetical protein
MKANRSDGPRVATTPTAYGHCCTNRVVADVCYRRNARTTQDTSYNVFRWDWALDWLVAASEPEDASA